MVGADLRLLRLADAGFTGRSRCRRPRCARPISLTCTGMLMCFVLNAALLVVFITRINRNLRERDAHLAGAAPARRRGGAHRAHGPARLRRGARARHAARHAVGDPRRLAAHAAIRRRARAAEEIAEMQAQLQRCKTIVSGILLSAGEARGEGAVADHGARLPRRLVDEWRDARAARTLRLTSTRFGEDLPIVSDSALKQMICNVLDNALRGLAATGCELRGRARRRHADAAVSDRGPGFAPEMLAQLGKPYQSSKGRPAAGSACSWSVNVVRKLGRQR